MKLWTEVPLILELIFAFLLIREPFICMFIWLVDLESQYKLPR